MNRETASLPQGRARAHPRVTWYGHHRCLMASVLKRDRWGGELARGSVPTHWECSLPEADYRLYGFHLDLNVFNLKRNSKKDIGIQKVGARGRAVPWEVWWPWSLERWRLRELASGSLRRKKTWTDRLEVENQWREGRQHGRKRLTWETETMPKRGMSTDSYKVRQGLSY